VKESRDNRRYDADLINYINNIFCKNRGDKVFERYIRYLQTIGDVSERTLKLYIKDLFGTYNPNKKFVRSAEYTLFTFLSIENIKSKQDITRETLRNYIVWLVEHGIANSSVNRRISALRSFYKFLLIEELVETSPIPVNTHVRNSPRSSLSLKMDKRLPVFLTQQEMSEIISTPDATKPEGKRDLTILELLYASGLRVSEVTQLNLNSFDLESREIRVTGKGSKTRIVLMGIPAATAIKEYVQNFRPLLLNNRANNALFLNSQGKRLSVRWIQKMIKHYAASIGLEKNVHPHVLRHTFATHMQDGGADLRVVQELLGHADLSSTQIYTHVTKQQARKVYLTAHPLAQEKG
jgi:site-specific recombinase XerD